MFRPAVDAKAHYICDRLAMLRSNLLLQTFCCVVIKLGVMFAAGEIKLHLTNKLKSCNKADWSIADTKGGPLTQEYNIFNSMRRRSTVTFTPKKYKIVKGVGKGKYPLVAFDNALRNAGIGDYNLVKVSSIIPAHCQKMNTIVLEKGSILYAAYSTTTIYGEKTSYVGVAVALPENKEENGVIFECCSECDPSITLHDMCSEAMDNRSKVIANYFDCIQSVTGEEGIYTAAIAAVALW